jgi:hypothetical protein
MQMKTELARARGLPGSDTYISTHLMYMNDLQRDAGVVSLNVEAMKAFCDTITVSRHAELVAESQVMSEFAERGGFLTSDPVPFGQTTFEYMEYYNYECLKIACAFELHLKARLLSRDFVIHEIEKDDHFKALACLQRDRPIHKDELFALTEYHFDGKINFLPGLKETSLTFKVIAEHEPYIQALQLPVEIVSLVQEYRRLRNMIHLPGDHPSTPFLASLQRPVAEILIEFVRSDLFAESEVLVAKHGLNPAQLNRFRTRNA